MQTRKEVLQSYIEHLLLNGYEMRTVNRKITKRIKATDVAFKKNVLRVTLTKKQTNECRSRFVLTQVRYKTDL